MFMTEKMVRMRIPELLYKKYRILCIDKGLSMPKQTAQLIRKFVEVNEENDKLMNSKGKY
jgi:hypothetical protein